MKDLKTTSVFMLAVMYIREIFGQLSSKNNSQEKPDRSNQPAPNPSLPKNRFFFPFELSLA